MSLATASLIVAVLAFLVASAALYLALRQTKASELTAKIEQSRRDEEIHQAKHDKSADVTVKVLETASNEFPKIGVHNAGPAPASDVFVTFGRAHDGRSAPNIDWRRLRGELGRDDYLEARLDLSAQATKRFSVRLGWRDGNGQHLHDKVIVS